ncbi:cupin domain-containing protein [Streptomyces longwoodensis]|uniref:cupin domain-containing protein n=1 Tax=Streptomyces longwoodensis TaxID=68231 RepID=UPI00378E0B45
MGDLGWHADVFGMSLKSKCSSQSPPRTSLVTLAISEKAIGYYGGAMPREQDESKVDGPVVENDSYSPRCASGAIGQKVKTSRPDHRYNSYRDHWSSPFSLEWLLDPVTPRDFLERYYESAPLCVIRNEIGYFSGLPTLDDVDDLLTVTVANHLRPLGGDRLIRSEPDGTSSERGFRTSENGGVDVQAIYRAYHDGFTAVINRVHRRSAAVGRLCRSLQVALHHPVGANLYLTPARAQGFRPHVDMHDVFVLQLHGTKEWHVSRPSTELPLVSNWHVKQDLPDFEKYILMPGDTLYLPRGFRHKAVTGDSSSLHLTVGIHAFRWRDLFNEVLTLIADEDVMFRGALPAGYLDEPLDMEYVRGMARRASAALSDAELIEKAKWRIASKLIATDEVAGLSRFRSLDAIVGMTDESIVARPPETLCLVHLTQEQATIEFSGNFVAGPPSIAPALQFIIKNHRFAVGDLPGSLSRDDRIDLVKRLVTEGLLEVLCV